MEEGHFGTRKWLRLLLETKLSDQCQIHQTKCKYYCIDCLDGTICEACKLLNHSTHQVLRITRSTRLDGIKVVELKELLAADIDDIQQFKCNNDFIVYILTRGDPNKTLHPSKYHHCEKCNYKLIDNKRFCSLRCMLEDKVVKEDTRHEYGLMIQAREKTPTSLIAEWGTSGHEHDNFVGINPDGTRLKTRTNRIRKQSRPERSYGPEIV